MLTIDIRFVSPVDLPVIEEILKDAYPGAAASILKRIRRPSPISCCSVALNTCGNVVGLCSYEHSQEELFVQAVAVSANFRRQSVGSRLLDHLWQKVVYSERLVAMGLVVPKNDAAESFASNCGFRYDTAATNRSVYMRVKYCYTNRITQYAKDLWG